MNKNVMLTKSSEENEIKTYFRNVLELKQSGEEFPVNLDEVWMAVYERKDHAVNELVNTKNEDGTKRYIKGVDYQSFPQKRKVGHTYTTEHIYKLSVSGMEWFIARKVRPVFEVYRQVFHKVAEQKQLSTLDLLELTIKGMRENNQELQEVKQQVKMLEARTTTRPEEFTIAGYATLKGMHVNLTYAAKLGRAAMNLCKQKNVETGSIPDPRFGKVRTYPTYVLEQVFNLSIN